MISLIRINTFIILFTALALNTLAQDRPIGYWRSHLPYNLGVGVATDGSTIFAACDKAFFTIDASNTSAKPVTYSKVEGMSDIGMQCIGYDKQTGAAVLVYSDGNIDVFKENENTFYNIPDLKVKSISGSKTVNMLYTEGGLAYLSTAVGVLVVDLSTHNINETYQFYNGTQMMSVYGFIGNGDYFYTITPAGVYRILKTNPQPQNFHNWQQVSPISNFQYISSVNNTLFLCNKRSIYALVSDTLQKIYTCKTANSGTIEHIDAGNGVLLVSEFYPDAFSGYIKIIDMGLALRDSVIVGHPLQALQRADGTIWIADNYYGLGEGLPGTKAFFRVPPGPGGAANFDIYANNKEVWVAHGGYNDDYYAQPSNVGISSLKDDKWKNYMRYVYPPFDTLDDFVGITKDEESGTLYFASFLNGLFTLHADGSYEVLNANSVFDTSVAVFYDNQRQLIGLTLDQQKNLWVTSVASQHVLYVKTASGTWHAMKPIAGGRWGGPIVVDDNNTVWFIGSYGGVIAYNYNNTIDDVSDDSYYTLTTGVGTGNLPSNKVYSIAKDNNNSIWVGTDDGICIFSNCFVNDTVAPCDAQIPIVQYDQFAGYLFKGNVVRTIAVDGANRKWVGTDDGVWLLSSNAQKIIYRFTAENSPMPSDHVKKIAIDKVTGDVYIGTDAGLVSYRSTATEGTESGCHPEVFPNPVTSGYEGTIAIKGLVTNADVRITDINGQLVFKTTAYGGQAIWNGKDYKGHRAASGVYLVFVTNTDGTQACTTKIVFVQ